MSDYRWIHNKRCDAPIGICQKRVFQSDNRQDNHVHFLKFQLSQHKAISRNRLPSSLLLIAFAFFFFQCQPKNKGLSIEQLYDEFQQPASAYRPFVRWWWNGDKVDSAELVRELRLLKEAGIGGVEINPIAFPSFYYPASHA